MFKRGVVATLTKHNSLFNNKMQDHVMKIIDRTSHVNNVKSGTTIPACNNKENLKNTAATCDNNINKLNQMLFNLILLERIFFKCYNLHIFFGVQKRPPPPGT